MKKSFGEIDLTCSAFFEPRGIVAKPKAGIYKSNGLGWKKIKESRVFAGRRKNGRGIKGLGRPTYLRPQHLNLITCSVQAQESLVLVYGSFAVDE